MGGMNKHTGTAISGLDHVRQSVADILLTPIGSRVMLRDYGSDLFNLIDAPNTAENRLRIYAATVRALLRWEPRIWPQQVVITGGESGKFHIELSAVLVQPVDEIPSGTPLQIREALA